MTETLRQLPTGLLPDPPDARDFPYYEAAAGAAAIDWEEGFNAFSTLGVHQTAFDQGWSSSCVAQAVAPHFGLWVKKLTGKSEEFSRRFIYSQISLGHGVGAYLRDGMRLVSTLGDCLEAQMPSYEHEMPPSEAFMLSKEGITRELLESAKPFDRFTYRMIQGQTADIGTFAQAIRASLGVVGGFTGTNQGWTQPVVRPPASGEAQWNHAVFLSGYGTFEGRKCLFTRNSWGGRFTIRGGPWAGFQAIPEEYFSTPVETAVGPTPGAYVFNAWALVPDADLTTNQRIMDFTKKNEGKLVQDVEGSGAFGIVIGGKIREASPERLAALCATALMRNGLGVAAPKAVWDAAKGDAF